VFRESPSRRQRVLLVVGVIFTAGLGILLAFASLPARANLTDTTTAPAPTTTVVPTPDPAPRPAPAPKPTPKATPAPKEGAPEPTYRPPAATPTSSATPSIHVPSARVRGSAPSIPKPRQVHRRRQHPHVKRSVAPLVAAATKLPGPVKVGVAGAQVERTALASPATSGNVAEIFLLAVFALGALLVTVAMVIPASAARFTLPGRVVIEHQVDLAIFGIAVSAGTVLVYALGTAGL
jgi:hypothetical protein